MKWLLLLAFLANALFFIAQTNREADRVEAFDSAEPRVLDSIPSLRLLAELGKQFDRISF